MTPRQRIEKAYNDAQAVIIDYLLPGRRRNAENTVQQLVTILDDEMLAEAIDRGAGHVGGEPCPRLRLRAAEVDRPIRARCF